MSKLARAELVTVKSEDLPRCAFDAKHPFILAEIVRAEVWVVRRPAVDLEWPSGRDFRKLD